MENNNKFNLVEVLDNLKESCIFKINCDDRYTHGGIIKVKDDVYDIFLLAKYYCDSIRYTSFIYKINNIYYYDNITEKNSINYILTEHLNVDLDNIKLKPISDFINPFRLKLEELIYNYFYKNNNLEEIKKEYIQICQSAGHYNMPLEEAEKEFEESFKRNHYKDIPQSARRLFFENRSIEKDLKYNKPSSDIFSQHRLLLSIEDYINLKDVDKLFDKYIQSLSYYAKRENLIKAYVHIVENQEIAEYKITEEDIYLKHNYLKMQKLTEDINSCQMKSLNVAFKNGSYATIKKIYRVKNLWIEFISHSEDTVFYFDDFNFKINNYRKLNRYDHIPYSDILYFAYKGKIICDLREEKEENKEEK